ncbi:MAG: 1-acyl-sn-glycerol-3-phosphate acyltransferase [Cyclobacteriaceae bacterium]|nr:1-acyl-sn-glycerol-3-phosphate acyltransferase [Cyclobacteriaceae bacterium]
MKKALSFLLSPFFYLGFGLILVVFHILQVIAYNLFGYPAHKKVVDMLNYATLKNLLILGARVSFHGNPELPRDRPLIVISNHQSMFDIPPLGWRFRKHHPKYVSKIELGRNIPSISYNLRHGGSALIDRKNVKQALMEVIRFGKYIAANNYAACIFPEGTRGRDGILKKFKISGIDALLKTAPNALIVPFVIDGNYRLFENGFFPLPVGLKIRYTVLDPIEPQQMPLQELILKVENLIRKELEPAGVLEPAHGNT